MSSTPFYTPPRWSATFDSHSVAEGHIVRVARSAAVRFVRAGREHRTEHAVLHVKHGHVLVNHDLKPLRRGAAQKRG